jgi:GntR family transcriptional regulator/MocR family aminotransferase
MAASQRAEQALDIDIDRTRAVPIVEQISDNLRLAIVEGRLEPGARLPSWLDMATQLGVARGTVKAAYERLADEMLVVSAGAAGTRVATRRAAPPAAPTVEIRRPLRDLVRGYYLPPIPFQMGVPAQDAFPAKLWARIRTRAVRDDAMAPVGPVDPRGHPELRAQIASYLAISRGIRCHPDQVILTSGYRNGLNLALRALRMHGKKAWIEDPGYPVTRKGLELSDVEVVPVPVDGEGMQVARAIELAPDAALAVVTPSQQAPLGVAMSSARRSALLDWAVKTGGWIIEDDFLSELQLSGRTGPALAAEDANDRVIHIGCFSKTLSPALGLGFLVAPLQLAELFGEVAACLQPAPNATTQLALSGFIADGHYLRHLRLMKKLYCERRDALIACLGEGVDIGGPSGLAVIVWLPAGADDKALARAALEHGIAPTPLSGWYFNSADAMPGLLLGVSNLSKGQLEKACATLKRLIEASALDLQPVSAMDGLRPVA